MGIMMAAVMAFAAGVAAGLSARESMRRWVARSRARALSKDELREMGEIDDDSVVALCVPHLAETLIVEAEAAIATAKPYSEGYGYALAKSAGMIECAQRIQDLWQKLLSACREEKERMEEREKREFGKGKREEVRGKR